MYRATLRSGCGPALRGLRAQNPAPFRRFASTSASSASGSRSWKSSALRWGLAGGILYYYNTSPIFAEEAVAQTVVAPPAFTDSDLPTVDSVLEEKRKQMNEKIEKQTKAPKAETAEPETTTAETAAAVAPGEAAQEGEGEEKFEGAFNPETGEINWDCPCLGGMAHGPCGEEFKTAFSCFVYSEADPKGMDCIEKFQGMQECFRQYPDIYGGELGDDEEGAEGQAVPEVGEPAMQDHQKLREDPPAATSEEAPKDWADATSANKESSTGKDE